MQLIRGKVYKKMKRKTFIILLVLTVSIVLTACPFILPDDPTRPIDPSTVKSITLSGAKTSFAFGESFSSEGLVVTATMKDGTSKALRSIDYKITSEDFNPMKVGNYQAVVSIEGSDISESYEVTVEPANRLKVLMIGNSYADDTINYAYEIAKNAGIPAENILIADISIPSCSLDTHWNNALKNTAAYRFGLEKEGYFDGTSYTNWTMEDAIMYADWDFITLQQNSGNSGNPGSYGNLQKLMDYILDVATDTVVNPNANPNVKLVWHQTWAYAQTSANEGFPAYDYNQMTMYDAIRSCLQTHILNKEFAAIIPNGTAIQNARTSFIGDNLTRDKWDHLSEDAGRYIAAMGLVGTLTGRDMTKITWKPMDSGFNFYLSDAMIQVCKESWANAMASPYDITASKYTKDPDSNEPDLSDFLEGTGTESDPFLIQSAEDMRALSEFTKGKSFGNSNMYFKLTADIDLGTESWQPICSSANTGWVETANSFNANFDGNGKTITFVGNYTGDVWAKGLFSAVGGYIHDLTLRGSITTECGRVGSLASMAMTNARIENITSYVNITAQKNEVGGIIGYIAAPNVTLTNCINHGNISARQLVGGIVGGTWQNVTYTDCVNHGNITASEIRVGGIVGEKFAVATLNNCSNYGTVCAGEIVATTESGTADKYAGTLYGQPK